MIRRIASRRRRRGLGRLGGANRVAQDRLELCRIGPTRVTKVDLMVFAASPDEIAVAMFERERSHPSHGRGLGRIGSDVHDLDARALLERLKPQL